MEDIPPPIGSSASDRPTRPLGKFLEFVKEYKELVTTLAFFAGGVLWVFGYFATKDELHTLRDVTAGQNKPLSCLLEKHVQLLEGEQRAKNVSDNLVDVLEEIQRRPLRNSQFTESDIKKMIVLQQKRDDLRKQLDEAEKVESDARDAIMYRACDK